MPKAFHENRFESLQVLRAITALLILTEHVRFMGNGLFGVDIFFCLSGFMLMLSTEEPKKHFFIRRLIRLLPLYYLMTIVTFIVGTLLPNMFELTDATVPNLIKSLCFIPFNIGNGAIQPLVRVGWTLNCEVFFTILFAIGMRISENLRLNRNWRFVLPCALQLMICLIASVFPDTNVVLQFYGNPVMLNFLFGIAGFYIAKFFYHWQEKESIGKGYAFFILFFIVLLFFGLMLSRNQVAHETFARVLYWEVPALMLVLAFFLIGLALHMPKPLVYFGNISFSFYLLHYYPTMFFDRYVFDFKYVTLPAVTGVLLAIVCSIFLAYISYTLIEQKLTKALYNLLK